MIKEITEEEHKVITGWGRQGFVVMPFVLMPKGFVAYKGETPVVATWVYVSECKSLAWLSFTITNPEVSHIDRDEHFKKLFDFVEQLGRQDGIKCMIVATNNASMSKRLRENDFQETDNDIVHFVKPIKG